MQKCLGSGPSLFSLLINDRLWGGPARCQPCSLVVSASRMCLCFFLGGGNPAMRFPFQLPPLLPLHFHGPTDLPCPLCSTN